jgi:RNA polymerase sigma-70 factor (ECF subfamily)
MVIRVPDQRTAQGGYAVLDDRMLVLDFQAGHPEAFVEIHRRYGALARHVCLRFLPNRHDADEAFQETMIRVFQGLYRFNGRYALRPWIARIAKNVSLDILRGQARRPQADDSAPASEELPTDGDEADQIVERLVQRDLVLSILADLPETHRRAIVLREIEGRSHREIAHELDMSPSQAKALIHRAKGGFRRRWLELVADRGGLTGIALVPVIWLARFGSGLRRVVDRIGGHASQAAQTAQAAVPEAVSSTASAASAPVVTSVGEKLVAAGVTLLLAGGVTAGAAKIARDRGQPARQAPEAAAAVVAAAAPEVAETPEPQPVVQEPKRREPKGERADGADRIKPAPVVDPVVEPLPVEEPSPVPEPTVGPSPTPSPPPPAPDWSLSFTSSVPIGDPQLALLASRVNGGGGGDILFSQTVSGPILGGKGAEARHLYLDYWGSTQASEGSAGFWIFMDTPAGRYRYDASADLASLTEGQDGTFGYTFAGTYELTEWPSSAQGADPAPDLPRSGVITLTLRFWADGTSLYEVEVALQETPAPVVGS